MLMWGYCCTVKIARSLTASIHKWGYGYKILAVLGTTFLDRMGSKGSKPDSSSPSRDENGDKKSMTSKIKLSKGGKAGVEEVSLNPSR